MEEKNKKAKEMYDVICKALENMEWKFGRYDDELRVIFSVKGEDFDMNDLVYVDEERNLIRLVSLFPFEIDKDKINDVALAINRINYNLVDGCFDFDISDGTIAFRAACYYNDSLISPDLVEYMINVSCSTVDDYNDKLYLINKGYLSVEDFMQNFGK